MQLELFFQIIGLCPTSLSVTKYKEDATLILSILSIAQAITISALTIFTLNFGNTNIPKKASANAWTVSIEQLSAAASHLIIIVESLKWRNLFLEVKMQVNNAWEALGVIAKPTMKRNEMIFWIAIIVVGVALDLKVIISYTNRPELFRYTLFILPSNLINFFRIVQIAYYVRHLQKVLKLMESEVEGISEQSEYNRSVVNQNIIQVTDTVPKLMRLRVAYQHLERANKAINCLAGHGLVANVLRIFLKGICGCFWIYVSIYNLNFHEVDDLICVVISLILQVSLLTKMIDINSQIIKRMQFNLTSVQNNFDNLLEAELSLLSVQLHHHPLSLTAADYITIDLGLISSIVGAMVENLIVVIQFMPAPESNIDWKQWGGKKD